MYNSAINKPKRYDYAETQRRLEHAHEAATGQPLGDITINLLVKHNARLVADLIDQELKNHELCCTSYAALLMLHSTEGHIANPTDLCVCTGETRANMTRICDDLVKLGAVTRVNNAHDRRRVDLSITEYGINLVKDLAPRLQEKITTTLSPLTTQEKKTLEQLLLKLMSALEKSV